MSKLSELAKALIQKTSEKKVEWEAVDSNEVIAYFGQTSIKLTNGRGYPHGEEVVMAVSNIDGYKVDEETFTTLSLFGPDVIELYHKARRLALKADETIDSLIQTLRQR